MKKLLALLMFSSQMVFAQEMPEYMKDGVITVTLKNGKQYTFSTNEYMVVNRAASKELHQEQQEALNYRNQLIAEAAEEEKSYRKPWRATVYAGVGSDGHSVGGDNNSITVTERKAFVYGASLGRKVYKDFSLTGTVLSNQTYTLGLGYDFK